MVDPAWLARVRQENQRGAGLAGLGDAQSIVSAYETKRAAPAPDYGVPLIADTSNVANVLFAAAAGVAVLGAGALLYMTFKRSRKTNPGRRAWAY